MPTINAVVYLKFLEKYYLNWNSLLLRLRSKIILDVPAVRNYGFLLPLIYFNCIITITITWVDYKSV